MKKLITTALLFAGLTIRAQGISEKYFTNDTTPDNGIDYIPRFEILFVDKETKKDSIVIYPHICEYKDKGFVIEGFFLVFMNDNRKIKNVRFNLQSGSVKLKDLKTYSYPKSNKFHFLTCNKNVSVDKFIDTIYEVELNDKAYVVTNDLELYLVYMLGGFKELGQNWIK